MTVSMKLQQEGRVLSELAAKNHSRWIGGKNDSLTDSETEAAGRASIEDLAPGIAMLVAGLIFAVCLIAPTFICLRIEGHVSWSWGIVAIPLWILNRLYLCGIWCLSFISISDDRSIARKVFMTIAVALTLTSEIFIVLKLDGNIDWIVMHTAIPYLVYEGLVVMDAVFYSKSTLLIATFRFLQVVSIVRKVDGSDTTSWWTVFALTWATFGLVVLVVLFFIVMSTKLTKAGDEDASVTRSIAFVIAVVSVLLFAPFFIAAARLESGSFSTFYIILPLYILAGGLVLVGLGMFVTSKCCSFKIQKTKNTDVTEYTAVEGQV